MLARPGRKWAGLALAAAVLVAGLALVETQSGPGRTRASASANFVQASGGNLTLAGSSFHFAGINAAYVPHESQAAAARDLKAAAAHHFTVLRMFGFKDSGNPASPGTLDRPVWQYWSARTRAPAYNDGPTGLGALDYAIYRARQEGLRLIVPFVNNWERLGGMDAYVCWRFCTPRNSTGSCAGRCFIGHHDAFFTDPTITGWYRAWVRHVLGHVNPYTGLAYKNDPTILAWELANEPRCDGSNPRAYPHSSRCSPDRTILPWIRSMASYVKSVDRRHLLAVGDEGFLCSSRGSYFTDDCSAGDSLRYSSVPQVDLMTVHDYPNQWGECPTLSRCVAWGTSWIRAHIADARSIGKPAVLEEFGLISGQIAVTAPEQAVAYKVWTQAVYEDGGAGDLAWRLGPSGGSAPSTYDVSCPSATCTVLMEHSRAMARRSHGVIP